MKKIILLIALFHITLNNVFSQLQVISAPSVGNAGSTNSVHFGTNTGNNTSPTNSVYIGNNAGQFSTGTNSNSYVGFNCGNTSTLGGANSFYGANAGSNSNGSSALSFNNYFGYRSGQFNSGVNNCIFSSWWGNPQVTKVSNNNSIFGNSSGMYIDGGASNCFFGFQSGWSTLTGSNNVFVGVNAGYSNTTGKYNTFVGGLSGGANVSGNYNVSIGYNRGNGNFGSSQSNSVTIGSNATSSVDHSIILGAIQGVIATGFEGVPMFAPNSYMKVGINTSSPAAQLHIIRTAAPYEVAGPGIDGVDPVLNPANQGVGNGFYSRIIFDNLPATNDNLQYVVVGNNGRLYRRTLTVPPGSGATLNCGTLNFVPRVTAANTLGCSQIFDNGINVGINTTTPTSKLDVRDAGNSIIGTTSTANGSAGFSAISSGANLASLALTGSGGGNGAANAVIVLAENQNNRRWNINHTNNQHTMLQNTLAFDFFDPTFIIPGVDNGWRNAMVFTSDPNTVGELFCGLGLNLPGGGGIRPSTRLDVNCGLPANPNPSPSGLRFQNLPAGLGTSLVIDGNGFVFTSNDDLPGITASCDPTTIPAYQVYYDPITRQAFYDNLGCRTNSNNNDEVIKDLQNQIEELKALINSCCQLDKVTPENLVKGKALLYQNTPNPFEESTKIDFFIPEESKSASIIIYNLQGNQLMKFDISERNNASISINGKELTAGMYIYSLIIDGKEIDSKRMILTN
ncbi:MAG: T9SS type A sorting domain-containing protein [Chitinophagales bacterium]|nr:T9SS type A sorting domain-containing protein [Chitinophagales bacterium]